MLIPSLHGLSEALQYTGIRRTAWFGVIVLAWFGGGCALSTAPPEPALYQYRYTSELLQQDLKKYEDAGVGTDERRRLRDKMIFLSAREIDRVYFTFKNDFYGSRATIDTALDILSIGLTSAATFASGGTSQILAAAATGVLGSRLSFNKNFFKEKTTDVLLGRMDALRAERWSAIYQKTLNASDTEYSWYQADRDLVAYYQAGTLEEAFQNIVAESGAQRQAADATIKSAIERKYGAMLTPLVPIEQVAPLRTSYERFRKLAPEKQAACATAILNAYRALPDRPFDIDAPAYANASGIDKVIVIQNYAEGSGHETTRAALLQAYTGAEASCK